MSDRVRIVTGAASGIGLAVAERLAHESTRVVLVDVNADRLQRAAAVMGDCVEPVVSDVADPVACAEIVRRAKELGAIDVLVNVAGIMVAEDSVETVSNADLDRILGVNLKSIFYLGRHVIPELRRRGGGVIVNIASVHAYATMSQTAAYAASKGAVIALTRQMAIDLVEDGIRVVAVAPGSVDTPLTLSDLKRRGITPEEAGFATNARAIGRVARPSEVAEVVAWLCSDAATLLNGCTVIADAGLLTKLV